MSITTPAQHRLNVFQRLIRQWDAIHPYNAAQVMRLRGRPDARAIGCAWSSMLRDLDLSPLRVTASWMNGAAREPIESLQASAVRMLDSSQTTIHSYLTDELNRPF